jgi:hypothetical protein
VIHAQEEYVRGDAHTNTAEGYFSILKRGIYGIYQHVSEEHLHRYLAEFDFRYNQRIALGINDVERTDKILKGVVGKRLTYRTTHRSTSGVMRDREMTPGPALAILEGANQPRSEHVPNSISLPITDHQLDQPVEGWTPITRGGRIRQW